ncbi:hypothetical protein PQC07_gp060 [Aeromonas phage D3]|uniref:Uncharacterized protein n=2 Tax=Ludhianavirus TaxID=3044751 RepID=A0A514TV89_9CAUD|nr:hypothetical protein PQC07_gp060 [Aeromonas phage D3]YP_010668963.1 hypothetical protein PQC08_gp060 [Aeromonas phage D6]QDJ96945.1 hypothetical protein D3_0215 [Aeromonas phage D3]QDJ97374.1 hypothetical protein D6_0215 [Aeromonas phage D6]QEP52251.1 hypothetical protein D9_0044 [Aeromonas phage D9]
MTNNIPSIRAAGKFVAEAPFDKVVKEDVFYSVEANRTIPEMQALKLDLFKIIYEPLGYSKDDPNHVSEVNSQIETAISQNAVVVSLASRGRGPTYVLSTYIKSFPVADGVIYERVGIVADLGSCPPHLKDRVNNAVAYIDEYLKGAFGIQNPNVVVTTVPTRGYVSKLEAEAWEQSRQNRITDEPSATIIIEQQRQQILELQTYVKELEDVIKNNP